MNNVKPYTTGPAPYLTGPRAQTQRLAWAASVSPALRALAGHGEAATRQRKAIRRKLQARGTLFTDSR